MNLSDTIINSLIQQIGKKDPVLRDILDSFNTELSRIANKVDPPPTIPRRTPTGERVRPKNVIEFEYELTRRNIIFTWAAPQEGFLAYELRTNSSAFGDGDRVLTTSTLQAIIDPALTIGGRIVGRIGDNGWTIKSINADGEYATDEAVVIVNIPAISAPVISPSVINNFIILNWDEPTTTFDIDYYIIERNGVQIGDKIRSTFFVYQEKETGTPTFTVKAFDIAGNESAEGQVIVVVTGPTDFEVQDEILSSLTGTIVNGKIENSKLYVCINTVETIEEHFDDNSWTSPQDQIDAGYTLWIQPTLTTGSYEETFDFGTIYNNVIVAIDYLFEILAGSFTRALDIRVSDDDISYSAAFTTASFFATSARYVKVKVEFTSADDKGLLAFYALRCVLSVKREVDGGEADVVAADAAGTVISFNKSFKFVESITVTVLDTTERIATYDFAGGANPTDFKVLVFDAAGVRQDATISWKARGVL